MHDCVSGKILVVIKVGNLFFIFLGKTVSYKIMYLVEILPPQTEVVL